MTNQKKSAFGSLRDVAAQAFAYQRPEAAQRPNADDKPFTLEQAEAADAQRDTLLEDAEAHFKSQANE